LEIPRKPRKEHGHNGNGGVGPEQNGTHSRDDVVADVTAAKRPRPDDSEERLSVKKARIARTSAVGADHGFVIVDDDSSGAILISDD
jgi:hypothetical protein